MLVAHYGSVFFWFFLK